MISFSLQKVLRLNKKNVSPSKIYQILKPLSLEVVLLIKARYKNKFLNLHIRKFIERYNETRPHISGKDLTQLGLKPSPDYKKILTRLLYLQLDGKINSRHEALEWTARKYGDSTKRKGKKD